MDSASAKPKIGLYQPYPHTFGGMQTVVIKLAKTLPDFGYDPIIISPEEGEFTARLRCANLEYIVNDPGAEWHVYGRGARSFSYLFSPGRLFKLLRYWHQLSRSLRQQRIALLHCNDYRGVMLGAPAARLAGIPVIWHMHGFVPSRIANLVASALVERTVPVSRGMIEYLKWPHWLFGKYDVIHNGIEVDFATPTGENELAPSQNPPVVLALGRLHPCKGYETLIRAFKQVAAKIPAAECWIVGKEFGDGAYARQLRALAGRLDLDRKVKFHGYAADVRAYVAGCRVLAVPSHTETFGMAAVEAMLAGKPVVACRTGGLQEIVVDQQTGSLVQPGDEQEMASAIIGILNNRTLARKMGQAGRDRVLEHFTLQKMAASFADSYSMLLPKTT
jgi:glycosyltransferase involved in cell wall biosynthesis